MPLVDFFPESAFKPAQPTKSMSQGYFMRGDGLLILGVIALAMSGALFSMLYVAYFSDLPQNPMAAIFSIAMFIAVWAIVYGVMIVAGAVHDVHTARSIDEKKMPAKRAQKIRRPVKKKAKKTRKR